MSSPDILFKGVPSRMVRGFLADAVKEMAPERVVIPCAGAFSFAYAVASTGFPAKQIETCDITLYTSVVGAYLAGTDMRLEPKKGHEWLGQFTKDSAGKAAAVVLAIRILQYTKKKKRTVYGEERIRELRKNAPLYIEDIQARLTAYHEALGGVKYRAEGMYDLIQRRMHDRGALIAWAPPWYRGGYDKMYAGIEEVFDWDAPRVAQFDPDEWPALVDALAHSKSTTMLLYSTPLNECENPEYMFGHPWASVFVECPKAAKRSVISWFVSNKPDKIKKGMARYDISKITVPKYKMAMHNIIRRKSDIRVFLESREVVSYYRDLLVHRLALKETGNYCVLLVDGELVAAMGFQLSKFRVSGGEARQTFCFTPQHRKYQYLHKLALLAQTSTWFWEFLGADIYGMPTAVQTTMLARFPAVMSVRGIFKLRERTPEKDVGYKLSYVAEVKKRTRKETIGLWLDKWGGSNGNT